MQEKQQMENWNQKLLQLLSNFKKGQMGLKSRTNLQIIIVLNRNQKFDSDAKLEEQEDCEVNIPSNEPSIANSLTTEKSTFSSNDAKNGNTQEVIKTTRDLVDDHKHDLFLDAKRVKKVDFLLGIDSKTGEGVTDYAVEQLPPKQVNLVEVYATATFENSPYERLQEEELDSLLRCVNSIEHLKKNIATISIDGHCTKAYGTDRFKHIVQLRIHVKTENLWESPGSYLMKHLGRDRWDRRNGTVIAVHRIHQKN